MSDRPDHLNVELHGDTIAQLRETKRQGPIVLTYTDVALERWEIGRPVISCSLPVRPREQSATAFLNGLLPEGQTRNTLAAQRDLPASDTYGLLAAYGRDVAGALVFALSGSPRCTTPSPRCCSTSSRPAARCGSVHASLEDVTFDAMLYEIAGRHAWKIPPARATALLERWIGEITDAADDTPTGRYVQRRSRRLEADRT